MPFDHFISQVYLRHWIAGDMGSCLRAIRKSDLYSFRPSPRAICKVQDGNTNRLINQPRKMEETFSLVEHGYNRAISNIIRGLYDQADLLTIARFTACILEASPTALRLHNPFLEKLLSETAVMLDAKERLPKLRGRRFSRLLSSGSLRFKVDGRYSQSFGASDMERTAQMLTHGSWEFLHNKFVDSSFFTSDYPVALESTNDWRINNKIVPLTPELALRIRPSFRTSESDKPFADFTVTRKVISRKTVTDLNRLIVRSAEQLVIFRDDLKWIPGFIKNNADYRVVSKVMKFRKHENDFILLSKQVLSKTAGKNIEMNEELDNENWFKITPDT